MESRKLMPSQSGTPRKAHFKIAATTPSDTLSFSHTHGVLRATSQPHSQCDSHLLGIIPSLVDVDLE